MVYDRAMGATVLYGGDTYGTTFGDTWLFSKATGWKQLTPAVSPPPLTSASMAYDPTTETVVLFGGVLDGGTNSDETWTWDGVNWTRQFPPVSPSALVFNNETWEWDGTSKTCPQLFPASSPSPREATLAYDETTSQVVLFAGWTNGITYDDTWTYNCVDWVQQQPATSPPERADNGLAFDPILKGVVLFGGWNGENWSQVQTSKSPQPSSGRSYTYDGTTKAMLLFGGWVTDYQFTNSTWLFGLL
jgi:hypothetical protein